MKPHPRPLLLALALGLTAAVSAHAITPATPPRVPGQVSNVAWEEDMRAFARADQARPVPESGIAFIGSSSIRMWSSLQQDFPGKPVYNRGFGGSEVRDSTWYADRLLIPHKPCAVFLYAGDNDLNSGRTPVQVRDDVLAFVQRVHSALPATRVNYISIKPSPSRANLLPAITEANGLIRSALAAVPNTGFIDIYTPMLGTDGQPDPALFLPDMLHMKPSGYALWTRAIAPSVSCPK